MLKLNKTSVVLKQETKYPWEGDVKIVVSPQEKSSFTVKVRIPGWSLNQPLPGDLYTYTEQSKTKPELKVNNEKVDYAIEKGYAVLSREWKNGDKIDLTLPMEVRQVKANELVEDDRGKLALECGPIVYCVEEVDNPEFENLRVSEKTKFSTGFQTNLLNGVKVVNASGELINESFTAIPYYVWNNRGANKMEY